MQMGVCKLKRNEYDDAIFYFNQAMYYAKELGDEHRFVNTSYNLALTYFDMQKYTESIEILDKYIVFNDTIERSLKIDSRVLKANSSYKLGKRKEAVDEYFLIIQELTEEDQYLLAMLYSNIGEYYYESDELQESIKYINLAQKIKNRTDKRTLPYVLNIKGKVFFKQGLVDESMMIMELAMNMAEEYSNYSILFNTYKDLINIYESIDDIEKIKEASLNFLSVLDKNSIDDGRKYALTKLVEVELRRNNAEEAIKLLAQLGNAIENH
jgi:tetratricopeptide (TPR) repeat protein